MLLLSRKSLIVVFINILFFSLQAEARSIIRVSNQSSFDKIQKDLLDLIQAGEDNITISLLPGTYVAKENHILLNGLNAPHLKIKIQGKQAIIIPSGRYYRDGDAYQGTFSTSNSWLQGAVDVPIWSKACYTSGLIEVLSSETKLCRLRSPKSYPKNIDCKNAYVLITKWFRPGVYKIAKIEGNYIYFTATDLAKSSLNGEYNINDDYNYHKVFPRFKLCNVLPDDECIVVMNGHVNLPKSIKEVYEGTSTQFLTLRDCKIKLLELKGIRFYGGRFTSYKSSLQFENVDASEIWIHNCDIKGNRSNLISVNNTDNFHIEDCLFQDCYSYGINADNNSAKTIINNNKFVYMGLGMQNTFSVICAGNDYHIHNNTFENYGYGGIGVGLWHGTFQNSPCKGIVEKNELFFTEAYLERIDNYGIMDGGAIYVWTKNDGSVIRNNFIHGFSGAADNRGVFCDDGAYNVSIYNNVIIGIKNSFSIDSRRVRYVEKQYTPKSSIEHSNVNVVIRGNLVDGDIKFEGNEIIGNGCIKSKNYLLIQEGKKQQVITSNVSIEEEDITLDCVGINKGKVFLPASSYRQLRKSKIWKMVKGSVKKE